MRLITFVFFLVIYLSPSVPIWMDPEAIGGINGLALLGEAPYYISVRAKLKHSDHYAHFCSATILTTTKIISAAHCFAKRRISKCCYKTIPLHDVTRMYAVAATVKYSAPPSPDSGDDGQWRKFKKVHLPAQYDYPVKDIAIAFVSKPFEFNAVVNQIGYATLSKDYYDFVDYMDKKSVVELSKRPTNLTNKICSMVGFGPVIFEDKTIQTLCRVRAIMISRKACQIFHGKNMDDFICTSTLATSFTKGDSGGPIICKGYHSNDNNYGVIVGIIIKSTSDGKVSAYSALGGGARGRNGARAAGAAANKRTTRKLTKHGSGMSTRVSSHADFIGDTVDSLTADEENAETSDFGADITSLFNVGTRSVLSASVFVTCQIFRFIVKLGVLIILVTCCVGYGSKPALE